MSEHAKKLLLEEFHDKVFSILDEYVIDGIWTGPPDAFKELLAWALKNGLVEKKG